MTPQTTPANHRKTAKLSPGRYQVGSIVITRIPGKTRRETGHSRVITTWRDESTGKWIGYTFAEAKQNAAAKQL